MHIVVIGAGAIGSAIAAGLASSDADVTLIARGARLAWLDEHPIELESGDALTQVRVNACSWADLPRRADLVFVCTKTGDFAESLDRIAPHLAQKAIVITLQNGVDAPQEAAARLGNAAIVAGRVHGFFAMDAQRVRHVGVAPSIRLGCVRGDAPAVEAAVAQVVAQAGFTCEVSGDIIRDLWEKFMLAASLGGTATALAVNAGQVLATTAGERILSGAMTEIARIGSAYGVALGATEVEQAIAFVRSFPADATTSLQRDLEAGRPSEYDALTGAALRLARHKGIAIPTLTDIDARIRARLGRASSQEIVQPL